MVNRSVGCSSNMSSSICFYLVLTCAYLLSCNAQEPSIPLYNFCSDADNYTANSTYGTNLKLLLNKLSSNGPLYGFLNETVGNGPDRLYGLVLCRGDAAPMDCTGCLRAAADDITKLCPFRRSGIAWYPNCFLRYSNLRFLSSMDSGQRVYMWNVNNVTTGWPQFNSSLWEVLLSLSKEASLNPRRFDQGSISADNSEYPTIYAFVQCTWDITSDSCGACLRDIIGDLSMCCNGKIGGRVLAASCQFRYEVRPFTAWPTIVSSKAVPNITGRVPSSSTAPPSAPPLAPPLAPQLNVTNPTNSTRQGSQKNRRIALAVAIPVTLLFLLPLLIAIIFTRKRKAARKNSYNHPPDKDAQDISMDDSLLFDLATILHATNDFSVSNRLGEGGFGIVFKGLLSTGKEIAVKRLSTSSRQGVKELINEVVLLAKLQHRNLVRLLGVCLEGDEKLLIYEYVENKSLDTILFDHNKKGQLNWERRYSIILGIARGMLYLHEESQIKIIHRDLKASNVLLDANMNAKISDFGLARLFGEDQTQASTTRVVGTFGYMSPEYIMRGQFSNKSDVFSFGVLLLEIITGQKNNDFPSSTSTDLLSYVWENWSNYSLINILDPFLVKGCPKGEVFRCVQIGLLCVQEAPVDRPTMSSVVLMLNSNSMSTRVPKRPAFFAGYNTQYADSVSCDPSAGLMRSPVSRSEKHSANEMSVTELDPR